MNPESTRSGPKSGAGRLPAGARREAILEGALECFTRLGFTQATIDDVRRASGASVGSIYHHFGDKEGVAGALYVEALRRYQGDLLEKVLGATGSRGARTARSLVRGIVQHSIDWMVSHPDWSCFLFEMRRAEGVKSVEPTIRRETRAFFDPIAGRLERHVERGEIRRLRLDVMAALLVGPAQELVRHWLRAGVPENAERIRDELAEAAWRSVRADPISKSAPERKTR